MVTNSVRKQTTYLPLPDSICDLYYDNGDLWSNYVLFHKSKLLQHNSTEPISNDAIEHTPFSLLLQRL